MVGGYLWILILASLGASLIGGFFLCKVAMARAREAFGHSAYAALVFVPLANFVLMLKSAKRPNSPERAQTVPLLTGGLGVLTGFCMLGATAFVTAAVEQQSRRIAIPEVYEPMTEAAAMNFMVKSQGVENTLRLMAKEVKIPTLIDEVTTLNIVEGVGTQLRRTYIVTLETFSISEQFRANIENNICAYAPFNTLMDAGATFLETYVNVDGAEFGSVLITKEDCGL